MDERLYSRPLDVHRISEYPEVQRMITYLFDEMKSIKKLEDLLQVVVHYWKQNQVDLLIPRNGLYPDINPLEIVDLSHPT